MKIDWSKHTVPAGITGYKLADTKPNNIIFYNTVGEKQVEVLRISKDGITANSDVPVDEAAQAVIRALNGHIESMIEKASKREWVGLTDQEYLSLADQIDDASGIDLIEYGQAVIAKWKEKNSG